MKRQYTIRGKHAQRLAELCNVTLHHPSFDTPFIQVTACGWMKDGHRITRGLGGYNVDNYFNRYEDYLGPDDDGVEPEWEDA